MVFLDLVFLWLTRLNAHSPSECYCEIVGKLQNHFSLWQDGENESGGNHRLPYTEARFTMRMPTTFFRDSDFPSTTAHAI
jgi:hypothetical protein